MPDPIAPVTGASGGIGRAIVEELSRDHHVVATCNTNRVAGDSRRVLRAHKIPAFEISRDLRSDMYDCLCCGGLRPAHRRRSLPQRRMGEAAEVARAVRAIADGHLDYSTGQVLHVDGGFHLRIL